MKRTSKILILVLSLALVFAAVATVVSATADDINVKKNVKFDGAVPGLVGTASDGKNPSADGLYFQQGGRTGKVEIAEGADGNKYAVITQTDKVGANGPYAYFTTGGNASVTDGVLSLGDNDISNYKYYLFEADIMSPTGKFPEGGTLEPGARAFKAGGTGRDFWNTNAHQGVVKFGNDEGGTFLCSAADTTAKKYVNPYEFTKVSIVLENTTKEGDANIGLTSHVYVNGELWFSKAATNVPTSYHSDTPHAAFVEFRVNYTTADDPTQTLAVDNVKYATVPAGSETEVKDLVDYDKANMPLGLPVAQVGEVAFDNIDLALAAVAEGETLKLLANITTPFEVDKLIFIDLNGFTADVRPSEGFAIDNSTEGLLKVISSAGMTTAVAWDLCLHDPACEDESMHPLYFEDELAVNEKFFDVYNPKFSGTIGNDGKVYVLVGWKNAETGELITADSVVTEADVEATFVILEPVYEIAVKNFEYVKGGKTYEVFDGAMTLADVIKAADAGSTVKFFSDIKYNNLTAAIDIGKKLTLDLNGYTLIGTREGAPSSGTQAKTSLFRMTGGTDLTVTSSRAGGKIFNEGWNNKTAVGASGMFNWPNDSAILRINGNGPDGTPYLSIFSGNIVQGYGNAAEYHIDGGMFVCVAGDQQGLFDVRKAGRDASIKNAIFYASGNGVVAFAGRNTATDDSAAVTVDNCVIIGKAVASIVAPVVMTITNSYITGDVTAAISGTYKTVAAGATTGQANQPGTIILGNGNYIGGKVSDNVQYAEGVKLYDVANTLEVTYDKHAWKASADYTFDASSFDVTSYTETLNFSKITTDVAPKFVTVTWKDAAGNVIGQSKAVAGKEATPPADLKASTVVIPGWLNGVPAEWNESLVIPEGVDEYVITAKEGGAITPAAAVELFLNIKLNTHFEYRLYVPTLAEGIEVTAIKFNNADRLTDGKGGPGKYVTNYGKFTIDGKEFSMVDGWPGLLSAANDTKFEMTFTYEGETYSVTKTVSIVDYCNYILDFKPAEGQLDYSDEAKALAVNTANYLYNALTLLGKTDEAAKAKPIVEEHANLINVLDKENLPEVDLGDLSKYISGATLHVDTYSVYYRFDLTDEGKAAKIVLSTGATGSTKDKYNELGYILTNQTGIENLNKLSITITEAAAEGEEAVKVVKSFTIADYYALLAASGANEATLNAVEAMYAYAVADAEY